MLMMLGSLIWRFLVKSSSREFMCGSANAYGTIYVPFGASWEPGKRYIYTLIFGGGYDAEGDEILKPIEFDAETTDWVDDPNNVIEL